jgi:SAM-dependent methyltransferase
MDEARDDPTRRFSDLAQIYARCRPDYPESALDRIIAHCGLHPGSVLIDVGCGTGISSRPFALRGIAVVGIEPNAAMRAQAEAEPLPPGTPVPVYRDGRAEATGLPDAVADAVLSAQAFHWFDADAALREFHRILEPRGWVVLMWNERDETDPLTAAYGAVMRTGPGAEAVEGPRRRAGEVLLSHPLFDSAERICFSHAQEVAEEGLLGRAFSASYAPKEGEAAEVFAAALREVFRRFQQQGRVHLRYETSVYLAQRGGAGVEAEPSGNRPGR